MTALVSILIAIAAIALGLPLLLRTLGLHAAYRGPHYRLPGGRALIVTTSHDRLGASGRRTGVFASEMTAPWYAFRDGGMAVDIASIGGGRVPVDPLSLKWFAVAPSDRRAWSDADFQNRIAATPAVADIDFTQYDIVFLAGGWGAAYDFGQSETLARKLTEAWATGRTIGGVCHGPLGLLNVRDEAGGRLVAGRRVTAATDRQIRQLRISQTPLHPERELRAAGALFESRTAFREVFANHWVADGRLVTGQNQNAGEATAHAMMMAAGGSPTVGAGGEAVKQNKVAPDSGL